MDYAPDVKERRMAVVRDTLQGGRLELLDGDFLVARVPLGVGRVLNDALSFDISLGVATESGSPTRARMTDYYGNVVVDGLRVGVEVELDSPTIEVGQTVRVAVAMLRHA